MKYYFYSIHYNEPEFVKLQKTSIKKYVKDDFEFIVINNGKNKKTSEAIEKTCISEGVKFINIKNKNASQGSLNHLVGINEFKKQLLKHTDGDRVFLIDHDLFLIEKLDTIQKKLSENSLVFMDQFRGATKYIWPGLCYFNIEKSIKLNELDFGLGSVNGTQTDTGGKTFFYLKKYKNKISCASLRENFIGHTPQTINIDILKDKKEEHVFYHLFRGSNWKGGEEKSKAFRIKTLRTFLKKT